MHRRWKLVALVVLVLIAFLRVASVAEGGRGCAANCRRHMADCEITRCGGLSPDVCRDRCRTITGCAAGAAAIRTLATVVTECVTAEGRASARQRIDVVRENCPRTTIVTLESGGWVPDNGICQLYGESRAGAAAQIAAPLQRLAVSPDGGTIVVEVATAGRVVLPIWSFVAPEDGFYRIHADGGGMRRIGPPSRSATFKVYPTDTPPYFSVSFWPDMSFSPDGRFVVFTDRGPGPDGSDAVQVIVMDVENGARTQVSHFAASSQGGGTRFQDANGAFIDDDTIAMYETLPSGDQENRQFPRVRTFSVKKDGSKLREVPADVANPLAGGNVVGTFLSGRPRMTFPVLLPATTAEPVPGRVVELFTRIRSELVQVTHLGRSDTDYSVRNRSSRVFFKSSGDPLGTNPSRSCQLFSIGSLGRGIRQITSFGTVSQSPSPLGCSYASRTCNIAITQSPTFDPRTDTLLFDTTCDSFGTNPGSSRFLAVRGDGSGLRDVTSYPGLMRAADGSIHVELPGPSASPGRLF